MATITVGTMPVRPSIICAALLAILMLSGFSPRSANKGIVFEKLSVANAVKKAKAGNKHVFVYVFASWCGQCKQLKRTSFNDEAVGQYFNKNFINIAVDGESAEGVTLAQRVTVDSYPTLLIIDGNGNVRTKTKGVLKPYILINFGRRIVP